MLEVTWFVIWGTLWAVYFMLDGFDLGAGTLVPVLGKTEADRRVIYHSIGPVWDGNEVWLITAGAVSFAAFPGAYATMFSALYSPLMLILVALIVRGVSVAFRTELDTPRWRKVWDVTTVLSSTLAAFLLGVAFANIFKGVPVGANGAYHGNLLGLLSPYGILGGLLFVFLFVVHGALWIANKSESELHERAASLAGKMWVLLLIIAVLFLITTAVWTNLYANYLASPALFIIPLVTVAALILTPVFIAKKSYWKAWSFSSATIFTAALFGVIGMYPNLLPSSLEPAFSATIANSASSPKTLKIMLGVVMVFIPLVIIYQSLVYRVFKGKVTHEEASYGGY